MSTTFTKTWKRPHNRFQLVVGTRIRGHEETRKTTLTRALNVHEVRVGGLHKTLELVLLSLVFGGGVEEIDGESLMFEVYEYM